MHNYNVLKCRGWTYLSLYQINFQCVFYLTKEYLVSRLYWEHFELVLIFFKTYTRSPQQAFKMRPDQLQYFCGSLNKQVAGSHCYCVRQLFLFGFVWLAMVFVVLNATWISVFFFSKVVFFLFVFSFVKVIHLLFCRARVLYFYYTYELPYLLFIANSNYCEAILILWFVFQYVLLSCVIDYAIHYSVSNLYLIFIFGWIAWVIMDDVVCDSGFSKNDKIKVFCRLVIIKLN
jgi:hypothetical protein